MKVKGESDFLFHLEMFNSTPELKEATYFNSTGSIPEARS